MKKLVSLIFVFALIFVLGACNNETVEQSNDDVIYETNDEVGINVTDALGNNIHLLKKPERIVSLIPSNTEILFELGLGKNIVGVNDTDDYPKEVASIEKVGGMEYNVEKIISLQPDVVVAHEAGLTGFDEGLKQLEEAGIPVFVVKDATTFEETYETIEDLGKLTRTETQAQQLVEEIQAKIKAITEKVKDVEQKTAFVVVGVEPDIYAAGKGTFLDEMLKVAHVKNAVTQKDWPVYSAEDFVASNADVVLTTYAPDIETLTTNEIFAPMKAVEDGNVFVIDEDTTSRQGPRIAEGVEAIVKAVYPELYSE